MVAWLSPGVAGPRATPGTWLMPTSVWRGGMGGARAMGLRFCKCMLILLLTLTNLVLHCNKKGGSRVESLGKRPRT